jgi:NAD(P)-dependent dehydrogenase (short-subunit alcohol dehydrogenase family)
VPLADVEETDWDEVMNVNLKGVFLCMKYEIRAMLKTGGGAIVNMPRSTVANPTISARRHTARASSASSE